jgi:PAS domain S-box-containing protein
MVYSNKGFTLSSPGYLLGAFFFVSNIALTFAPKRIFEHGLFTVTFLVADMTIVSLVIYMTGGAALDLFLLYLLVIFAALPARSVTVSVIVALSACVFQAAMTYVVSGSEGLLQAGSLIKVPFLFAVAIFGNLISRQRAELARQKDENRRLSGELKRKLVKATESKEKLYEDVLMLYDYNDSILNSLDCGVMVIDLNGTVTAFNRAAGRITGLRCDDVLFSEARTNKTLEGFLSLMNKSLEKTAKRRVLAVETPSGQRKVIGISTYLLRQKKEKVAGVIAIFSDLTDAKDIQEISTFAMDQTKETESFDVNALLDEVVDSTIMKAEECEATIDWAPRLSYPEVSGDTHQLKSVLANIVLNSLRVVGKQGRIDVSTARTERGVVVEVVGDSAEHPNETQSQLFLPFAGAEPVGEGPGSAETEPFSLRQESIDLDSMLDDRKGQSAPRISAPQGKPSESAPAAGRARERANILVADNDNSVRTFYKVVLEKAGHNVLLAQDGGEAIRQIFNCPVDLVILEIKMPRVDGMQVIERVSRTHSNLPIIVCTGYTTMQTECLMKSANVVAYLTKPVSIFEFQKTVEKALKESKDREEALVDSSASHDPACQ